MSTNEVKPDDVQVEADFSSGIARDISRGNIPEGYAFDAADFMLEQSGRVYKRGGWALHSAELPEPPEAVFTWRVPTRVGCISDGHLYDVTSETSPEAIDRGAIVSPAENPTTWNPGNGDTIIICDGQRINRPKQISVTGSGGDLTIADLPGNPPVAAHSAVYASRLVLANGDPTFPASDPPGHQNRLWFSSLPGDLMSSDSLTAGTDWDVTTAYVDTGYFISGLAAIQGVLLIFSPRHTERILNGVIPGQVGADMELQPVGGVGCVDAKSICTIDNQVIFASQEGVFLTNGVAFDNLMQKSDKSGILSTWRNLFVEHEIRSTRGGMLMRDYYMLSSRFVEEEDEQRIDLMCYLPTRTWWRTTNTWSNCMAIGQTEQETVETYSALAHEPYVAKLTPMLRPSWANRADGNGVPVAPMLETRMFGTGAGLKAYGFGRMTYDMRTEGGTPPTMAVSEAVGLEAETYVPCVESPLPATTKAERARFSLFRDSQSLNLRFAQTGESSQTEIFLVEVENRAYNAASDGE